MKTMTVQRPPRGVDERRIAEVELLPHIPVDFDPWNAVGRKNGEPVRDRPRTEDARRQAQLQRRSQFCGRAIHVWKIHAVGLVLDARDVLRE